MFGSDTMMKFNIIKNELHNIMRSQLKRVDGEVSAMAQRIKALDDNLALSEQYIKTATATLAEAVQVPWFIQLCKSFLVYLHRRL
jgi:hypothetical protein